MKDRYFPWKPKDLLAFSWYTADYTPPIQINKTDLNSDGIQMNKDVDEIRVVFLTEILSAWKKVYPLRSL